MHLHVLSYLNPLVGLRASSGVILQVTLKSRNFIMEKENKGAAVFHMFPVVHLQHVRVKKECRIQATLLILVLWPKAKAALNLMLYTYVLSNSRRLAVSTITLMFVWGIGIQKHGFILIKVYSEQRDYLSDGFSWYNSGEVYSWA